MDETAPEKVTESHRFPCPQCGADYRFEPGQEQLVCDHCGSTEQIGVSRNTAIKELDIQAGLGAVLPAKDFEETRVSQCPNCAAQVEFDSNVHAAECPFCATPVVTDTGTQRQIKPRAVLPFALDEPTARGAMTDWLGALWFAPNGLKQYARKGRAMNGIYVPYWTYDAETVSAYSGERGTVYYETQTVMRDGKRVQQRVAKIRWRGVRGRVARFFDDVLVLASKSLPKKFTDALEPWDLAALEPYRPEYLAGFRAEGYSVTLAEGFDEARAYMGRVIEQAYFHAPPKQGAVSVGKNEAPLMMLIPLWVLTLASIYFGIDADWTTSLARGAAAVLEAGPNTVIPKMPSALGGH